MKKNVLVLKVTSLFFSLFFCQFTFAQLADGFDIKKAYKQAADKGINSTDIEGYVKFLHNDYLSHKNSHTHASPNLGVYDAGTIYLNGNRANNPLAKPNNPNSPQNAYCPNAGFEQGTFANWIGSYGAVSTGAAGSGFPTYTPTSPTIVNPAGNNVSLVNSLNYHTIMTTPAINNVYPNCIGWDSIACKVVGTQTISEVPVVNPNGGPASVRLNGAMPNYRASKLNYNMTLNPNNKNFNVSYAIVLSTDKSFPHTPAEQPYFSVKITDQNGNSVPGCSQYTVTIDTAMFNTSSPNYDPTWTESALDGAFSTGQFYRKWSTYAFDFSNYPSITAVNVEFYVGGCTASGHFGYAYVDAECSQGGAVASFCAGSNTTILNAPTGYSTYQWTGPSGPVSIGNGGNTGSATITPVTAGQVFTCNVTAPNGCSSIFQTTVSITTVSITAIGSTPSCQNGNSGTTSVSGTGSSMGYTYQWLNSLGGNVGNTQIATGLSPGIYSVTVSSGSCGSATATVQVGISAPNYYSLAAPFCGSVAWITNNAGSNYKWYTGANPPVLILGATSSSLTINSPVNGDSYFLGVTLPSGCRDSIKYVLAQSPGGSIYTSNIKSICAGNNNSYAVINLQTAAPPVYSYTIAGPSGYSSTLLNTNLLKDSISGLSIGTYSATVFDGQCIYNTTFTVSPFVYNYTLTPSSAVICTPGSSSLSVNFGNNISATCGLDPSVCLTGSPTNLFSGPFTQNGTTTYPTPYGNWYTYGRNQYLLRQSDLNAAGINAGKISSLAFNVLNLNTSITSYPNFYIKMGCTGLASLPDVTNVGAQPFIPGLQTVYANANQPIAMGWVTHNFSQAYVWDGTSNIIIEVCFGMNTSSNYTQNASIELKQLPYVASMYHVEDTSPVCSGSQSADNFSGGLMASGQYMVPNMKLGYCGGQNPAAFTYSWTPTTGLSSTTSYTTIANPTVTTVYTVQVNPIGQNNCMQAQSSTITVASAVAPTITPVSTLCSNAASFSLSALPAGGSWSLTAPTSTIGVFTPSLAAVGNNTVTYLYGGAGCLQITTAVVPIEKFVPSAITGALGPFCIPNSTVNLSTALTTSTLGVGAWSGPGVTGTIFNPNTAGIGTQTLTYNTNSIPTTTLCPSTSTISVTINSAVQPTITSVGPFCTNAASLALTVIPIGGVWSGSGISANGILTPSMALAGDNTYNYTVGASTCSATNSTTISIEQYVPSTIVGSIPTLCITNPTINLATALTTSTLGVGLWTGNGVTGATFNPLAAGSGTHTLTYSTNSNPTAALCPSASTTQITVNTVVQPTISAAGPFCDNYTSQQMVANPTGGVWNAGTIGTSISTGGLFSPSLSLIGNNKLYYILTNAPCVSVDSTLVDIIHFVPATITGALGPFCIYDASTNLQSIEQFAGGVWSGVGVNTASFTPSAAGAGTHIITYSTNPSPLLYCGTTETISILVNDKPNANAISDINSGCNPVVVNYMTTTVNTGNAIWNFGDGSPAESGLSVTHTYTTPGTYTANIVYTDPIGCKDSTIASSGITVFALPIASFDPSVTETTVVDGQVEFTNQSTVLGNNSYAWNFGGLHSSAQVNESYLFANSGNFVVTLFATSTDGCVDDTSVVITVNPDVVLYVPNAFTPGNDALNDVFQIFLPPTGVDFSTFNLLIYDRWGELIYQTNDVNKFWTGAKNNSGPILKQDSYVYKISFKDENRKYYEKLGHVILLIK